MPKTSLAIPNLNRNVIVRAFVLIILIELGCVCFIVVKVAVSACHSQRNAKIRSSMDERRSGGTPGAGQHGIHVPDARLGEMPEKEGFVVF